MSHAEQAAQSRLIEIAGYQIRLPEDRVRIERNSVTYDFRPLLEALEQIRPGDVWPPSKS